MSIEIVVLPKMGESVAEATIISWLKNEGDSIEADDVLVEIATDKVDTEVLSPFTGKIISLKYSIDDTVQVGAVIAEIETSSASKPLTKPKEEVDETPAKTVIEDKKIEHQDSANTITPVNIPKIKEKETVSISTKSDRFYSPLVKSIAKKEGLSQKQLDQIQGTGKDKRLTKNDLLNYLKSDPSIESIQPSVQSTEPIPPIPLAVSNGDDEIIEMDRVRQLISTHMLNSQRTSAHVTSFIELDVTNIVNWRNANKEEFQRIYGESLTFTPIFIEALAKTIQHFPMVNVSVEGKNILVKKDINIGMATALPNGNLIVPIIKNADQLNLLGIAKKVNDLANRARHEKLTPDDTSYGTYTMTNIGSFGSIMGTPIINQPQVAIMAIGAIKKKPAVIETEMGDTIGIRQMMYMSHTYDHRIIDGAMGSMFLKMMADELESFDSSRKI
ncbi:MAG: 2-oxo acid dehydrogenase subunit E2 [Flavobacteriales bacterium]|nr:2-oxo acid dehydrogenase subunit E2 [Flavobacteriales bacterium]